MIRTTPNSKSKMANKVGMIKWFNSSRLVNGTTVSMIQAMGEQWTMQPKYNHQLPKYKILRLKKEFNCSSLKVTNKLYKIKPITRICLIVLPSQQNKSLKIARNSMYAKCLLSQTKASLEAKYRQALPAWTTNSNKANSRICRILQITSSVHLCSHNWAASILKIKITWKLNWIALKVHKFLNSAYQMTKTNLKLRRSNQKRKNYNVNEKKSSVKK